jgi:hypothetical protein
MELSGRVENHILDSTQRVCKMDMEYTRKMELFLKDNSKMRKKRVMDTLRWKTLSIMGSLRKICSGGRESYH